MNATLNHRRQQLEYPEWPQDMAIAQVSALNCSNARGFLASRRGAVRQFEMVHDHDLQKDRMIDPKSRKTLAPLSLIQLPDFLPAIAYCKYQVTCHRKTLATRKCLSCVKFDPAHNGFYCESCFTQRHPPYRMEHSWVSVKEITNQEVDWFTHVACHPLEQETKELENLLTKTQQMVKQTCLLTSINGDPNASQIAKQHAWEIKWRLAAKQLEQVEVDFKRLTQFLQEDMKKKIWSPLEAICKIQSVWRTHRTRQNFQRLLRNVFQEMKDPQTGQVYYYNKRTKQTQWHKPKAWSNERRKSQASKTHQPLTPDQAAVRIQGAVRTHQARARLRKLISSVYEKIWDEPTKRFYYHNTKTKTVSWQRPTWVNDADLKTPRSRLELNLCHVSAALPAGSKHHNVLTPEEAAAKLQRMYRRRSGFLVLKELSKGVYERIFDAEQNTFYYHNTRTNSVTWEKPRFLHKDEDIWTPRTRERKANEILNKVLSQKRGKTKQWTAESAAICVQGLFRARKARQSLNQQLWRTFKKVQDEDTGQFYYFNTRTGTVSWVRPSLLGRTALDLEVLGSSTTAATAATVTTTDPPASGVVEEDKNTTSKTDTASAPTLEGIIENSARGSSSQE